VFLEHVQRQINVIQSKIWFPFHQVIKCQIVASQTFKNAVTVYLKEVFMNVTKARYFKLPARFHLNFALCYLFQTFAILHAAAD
jgi:hypothetical protein